MASFNTSGLRPFVAGPTSLSAFTRVMVNSSGVLQCAGPTGVSVYAVGYLDFDSEPNLPVTVRMPTCPGSRKGIADTAITAWGYVYASLSGYVTGAAGTGLFSALAITLGLAAAPSGATVAAVGLGAVFEFVPIEDCPGW